MANMESTWDTNAEDFGSMLSLDDPEFNTDFSNFFDANPVQETTVSQQFTSLDSLNNFDFGLQNHTQKGVFDSGFDSGYQSSPANSQANENSFATVPYANAVGPAMETQLGISMPLSAGLQLDNMLQHSNTTNSGQLLATGEQDSMDADNSGSAGATSYSTASKQKSSIGNNRGGNVHPEPNGDVSPKIRKTRKRKAVSKEEQESKKRAFLARNREAARKCRVKKKDAHEELQETHRTVVRNNAQFKADTAELRAMKEELLMELSRFQRVPGMIDEIKAIEQGNPSRPPMFKFVDNVRLVSISGPDSELMSQRMSRHHSNISNSAEQSVNTALGGYTMSRQNSNGSNFGQPAAYPHPVAFNIEPMSRSNSNASTSSQQQFPFPRMASIPPNRFPRRISDAGVIIEDITGFYPPQHSAPMSRKPSQGSSHGVTNSSGKVRQGIPPISTRNPSDSHGSSSSQLLMARSGSQSSGRDSGIGNISPTTPKNHNSGLPDEGISEPATTVVPNRMVDPALLNGDVNLFGSPQHPFHQMMDPGDFLRRMNMSGGPAVR